MQDLSALAKKSLATDSMHGGNQVWARTSMSADGSVSGALGDKPGEGAEQASPEISVTATLPIGTDGKPQASGQSGAYKPAAPRWVPTTIPDVLRKPATSSNPPKGSS